jgi:hypothetical protein
MSFETQLELAETQWHDAQLCRLSYILSGDAAEAVLELQLYATPRARDRHVRVWRFLNVHDLVLSANGPELQSHHGPGHVIQARLFESDGVDLNVYFCGAYLRITADGVNDLAEVDPFGDAANPLRDESAASAAAQPSKAMTAADAEAVLDFPATDDWFDGRLRRLTFMTGREVTDVVLDLELRNSTPDSMEAEREPRSYRFRTVKDVTIALNSAALRRQRVREGHITQGRMNYGQMDHEDDNWEIHVSQIAPLDLSVYTTGGFIRIAAKAVETRGA